MGIEPIIYLDYNATTPVAPEAVNEMLPVFLSNYGNPSSNDHLAGWQAQEMVEEGRKEIAALLGVKSKEIVFTAGATEAINLALRGLVLRRGNRQKHVISLASEHNAVLDTCAALEAEGVETSYISVDTNGLVNLQQLEDTIKAETIVVCVMMANNETGVVQPIKEISTICKLKEVLLLSDTTQVIGKMPLSPHELGIDISVGSAHKFYGPKGVGFLCLIGNLLDILEPIITGGGQEHGKRAGTLNVPGIIGMAKAVSLAKSLMVEDTVRIGGLRNRFEKKLSDSLNINIIGKDAPRLFNTSNIGFRDVDAEKLMQTIGSRVAASRGSACSSDKIEPSHVLMAMGMSEVDALSSIRFSFGRYTTEHEVDVALELIEEEVNRLES